MRRRRRSAAEKRDRATAAENLRRFRRASFGLEGPARSHTRKSLAKRLTDRLYYFWRTPYGIDYR